jgi:hypothetical protein
LLCDIAALGNSVTDMLSRCRDVVCKLRCDARHKLARMAYVAAAAREEEAGRQTLLVMVLARDRPRDGRLARARQAAQPEDAPLVLPIRPAVYLAQEVDARVGEADRLVLLGERVEGRVFGVR